MKLIQISLISTLLITATIFSGCTSKGTMNVSNDTNGQLIVNIDGDETVIESGKSASKDWKLNNWLLSHESKDIKVTGSGDYKVHFSYDYEIKPNKDKSLNITADAGRICFHNNSIFPLTEVYIADAGDREWGYDWLLKAIEPGDSCSWQVLSGYHCFAIVDTVGNYWIVDWVMIVENITYECFLTYGAVTNGDCKSISGIDVPDIRNR
jgi:hypothetical protein